MFTDVTDEIDSDTEIQQHFIGDPDDNVILQIATSKDCLIVEEFYSYLRQVCTLIVVRDVTLRRH